MLDETIVTAARPLYYCYGPIGQQERVPISGEHAKRVLGRGRRAGPSGSRPGRRRLRPRGL
jgi:hypothetical protein